MFGLLDDDDDNAGADNKSTSNDLRIETTSSQLSNPTETSGSDSAWTDVSSTKSRRLAPQWTSTKSQEKEKEKEREKDNNNLTSTALTSPTDPKKKGINLDSYYLYR